MLVSPVIAQPPPDLPEDYWEGAYLGDEAATEHQLSSFSDVFWKIDIDSEIEDCMLEESIQFYAIVTIAGSSTQYGTITPIPVLVSPSDWSGNFELDVATLLNLAGLGSNPGQYHVSHMAFFLYINGVQTGNPIYPGANPPFYTGLPAPCDCLQLYFDTANHRLTVYRGFCSFLR